MADVLKVLENGQQNELAAKANRMAECALESSETAPTGIGRTQLVESSVFDHRLTGVHNTRRYVKPDERGGSCSRARESISGLEGPLSRRLSKGKIQERIHFHS